MIPVMSNSGSGNQGIDHDYHDDHKPEHVDQDAERELRAAFHEDIRAGRLSITDAVTTMRRISRLTPAAFAKHRGVDVNTLEQIESGAADPMVATLNQIGAIYGLEVRFVPVHKPDTTTASHPAELLPQAHEDCLALAAYREMSFNDFNAISHDGIDKIADLAAGISYSADAIALILTQPDIAERDEIRKLAKLYGDRERGGSLTARCLHHYVTQQIPALESVLHDALKRNKGKEPE